MTLPIIEITGLGKKYQLGAHKEPYLSIRDSLARSVKGIGQKLSRLTTHSPRLTTHNSPEDFWALRDVSFSVQQGEAVGIIGRNGAGKSTLLKILSQITPPTEGKITCRGRIASLLEVGTGFHPELTGRENIYLNGAILGMTRAEIKRKFDEIVAFSEVEKFLDTPVKRYSSGMYVRLAFAVAANLDPEILIIDEVLAVGDSEFQKKCLGRMAEVAKCGRTVIFVSHNMSAISALCKTCVLIKNGSVDYYGVTEAAIERYLSVLAYTAHTPVSQRNDRKGNGYLKFTDVWLENSNGSRVSSICSGDDVSIVASYDSKSQENHKNVCIALALRGNLNESITDLRSDISGHPFTSIPPRGKIVCKIPRLPLNAGRYGFNIYSSINGNIADWIQDVGEFHVEAGDYYGSGKLPGKGWGPFLINQEWKHL